MIWDFVLQSDTTQIESQIYGYCDDRGDNDYNYKLYQRKSKYRSKNSNGKWI
jgi:hypothetical protein